MSEITTLPTVIARRASAHPSAHWEARVNSRGRLEIVLSVQPHATTIDVLMLSAAELKTLLSEAPAEQAEIWSCGECGHLNPITRRWCSACSNHEGAIA